MYGRRSGRVPRMIRPSSATAPKTNHYGLALVVGGGYSGTAAAGLQSPPDERLRAAIFYTAREWSHTVIRRPFDTRRLRHDCFTNPCEIFGLP